MKNILITIFLIFGITLVINVNASAEVYVIYDLITKEVISAINKDQAVMQVGQGKVVLPGTLDGYGLTKHPTYYKLSGKDLNTFVENNTKISAEINATTAANDEWQEFQLIQKKMQKMACDQLVADGVKFVHIQCDNFK